MNNKYYKSGGPVFLSIGGEGPANPVWMENGAWIQYAQEHNAMLFMVEHRYYGQTHPTWYGSCLLLEGISYIPNSYITTARLDTKHITV